MPNATSNHPWHDYSALERIPLSIGAVLIGTDPNPGHDHDSFRMVLGGDPVRYNATIYHKDDSFPYWSEYQHHVTVHDLEPDTVYYYKCVVMENNVNTLDREDDDDDKVEMEEEKRKRRRVAEVDTSTGIFQFQTGPVPGPHGRTKVAIVGDLGVSSRAKETLSVLSSRMDDVDSVILVGDISYATGSSWNVDHR